MSASLPLSSQEDRPEDVPLAARLQPPARLLCGPGPSNVHPRVLEVLQEPMLGHLDPAFHEILAEIAAMLAAVWRRDDGLSIAISASGTSGMEAGLAALVEPGDTVIVGVCGFFGRRIADVAARYGASVVEVDAPLGREVPVERLVGALDAHPEARLVALVHAETSTGVENPLPALGAELRDRDVLLLADCVTSLGGLELETAEWGVDYAYACTQKCLGAPPGIAPITVSERALDRIRTRRVPVPFSFDLELLAAYWVERPAAYHHTTPNLQLYALHEALRLALEEGLEARAARHADAGAYLQEELAGRGLDLLSDPSCTLPMLSAVRIPAGVDGPEVQRRMLARHGIEIGGGLGPGAPPIWRIGLMGVNATRAAADRVLEGLDDVLRGWDGPWR